MEHFGRAVADGFSCALVVADPSYNALSVAKECSVLARQLGINDNILVVNRVGSPAEADKIYRTLEGASGFFRTIELPFDPEFVFAEPAVSQLLSGDSEIIKKVRVLTEIITDQPVIPF
jgi:CO dehydrogenase maturation factor